MVTHIVLWKLADQAAGADKTANAREIKKRLEALVGVIPGLRRAVVGVAPGGDFDCALIAQFDSPAALKAYDTHPAHLAVKEFVAQVRLSRVCFDFEGPDDTAGL